ncbi:MAG: NAD-glutamate dehydrogenase domain-containing protein, partial [Novosphingobium sp.]
MAAKARNRTTRDQTASAHHTSLVARMAQSILPGDTPLSRQQLNEAAHFLIDVAQTRKPHSPAIAVESAAESHRYTRIAIVNRDMPFLVDSVAATISAHGLAIDRLIHPVIDLSRNDDGTLKAINGKTGAGSHRESLIYMETARIDARQRRELSRALASTLADVRASVDDWPQMQAAMDEDAVVLGKSEGADLLHWLNGGRLTQLGHCIVTRDGKRTKPLGICRTSGKELLSNETLQRAIERFGADGRGVRAPLILKANLIAQVHRRVPCDILIVPRVADGRVTSLSLHAGLWTSAALATPPSQVPRLREALDAILKHRNLAPESHDAKALVHALTMLPHDLLVSFPFTDVERIAGTMMSLGDRPRPRLAIVNAALDRHLFAFAWLPRDMVSTAVREEVQNMLMEASGGTVLDWSLSVEGGAMALWRFMLDVRGTGQAVDEAPLDAHFQAMLRGWCEAVEAELIGLGEEPGRAAALAARYAEAFPVAARARYGATEAARDVQRLRQVAKQAAERRWTRDVRLYHLEGDPPEQLRLKIYQHGGHLPLSDAVPALENFGFRVLTEIPTSLDGGAIGAIHDFTLSLGGTDCAADLLARAATIENAIRAVLNNKATSDPFNRLVTQASLDAGQTDGMRAIYRYLRQTGTNFTLDTAVNALVQAGTVTQGLIRLFHALHDPAIKPSAREDMADTARRAISAGLAKVDAINDDRLLRAYHAVIEACERTNAFAPTAREALVIKLDSSRLDWLPRPLPWREVFVYAQRMEGIHLRAGPVARGGIRWSDRRDDFRTEILGLMKAQRVKNAVIVPTGAKGGFYPKMLPDPAVDREAWAAEGQASYELFIRALLSITDNIVDGKVVHPQDVVIRDKDDPYFVVAADKGTARFSDVANAIAEARDFWLNDAFASGGSHGYDHKAMGITARGAWVSVQRHFREMGVDVQKDPITVAGCGDMSGDVFGNGMLLSSAIRLVAAFDHRHIFIDPAPDAAASWKERKRLFALPRSSWADYDKSLVSKGGGVFSRNEKRIALSKEARAVLGIVADKLEPDALIAAILKAPVDLMWFGGIGTYVKSSEENNATVGDRANDALRVDGRDVRARVIGEGANLGVTQAGRIEFALKGADAASGGPGGRINTDFIDNSAGVDCSDNEVNIKIALAAARRAGRLSEKRRNAILAAMTDDVAALVLEDNRLQTMAISIAERGGARAIPAQLRLIETLERDGAIDRKTDGIADDETLTRRGAEGKGLVRPEIALLLSTTKLTIQSALENSTVPNDDTLVPLLLGSFPDEMQAHFRTHLLDHRLRREIIATELANLVVNRLGLLHPFELREEEGASLAHVCAAFVAVERLFGLGAVWVRLDTTAMPESARLLAFEMLALATRNHMADALRAGAGSADWTERESSLADPISALRKNARALMGHETRERSASQLVALRDAGVP